MKSRPVAATFFVAICLLLCGVILHRQIAAHPLPPHTGRESGRNFHEWPQDTWMNLQGWHTPTPAIAEQARGTVQGQLTALHDGNGLKAMSYQSRFMRRMFVSPTQFETMIVNQYPEFGQCRKAHYGPMRTDKTGQNVRVVVMVEGENGHHARGEYMLIREGTDFKISGVRTERMPD